MSTVPDNTVSEIGQIPISLQNPALSNPRVKRWNREEYYQLYETGYFQGQRVELIDGEILVMSPQSYSHYLALDRICRCLEKVFGQKYWVRSQGPVTKGEFNEPEPDVCVEKGPPEEHDFHPTSAVLVVEVSKTSLRFDKTTKQSLYASMNVPDYWVLDLENRQLLVYRQPVADEASKFGHRYESLATIAADGQVASLEKPEEKLAVGEMLPPVK